MLKVIAKETIKEHISAVPDELERDNQNQEKSLKQRKGKIQTKPKTWINEQIRSSNRFSPIDKKDPDGTTTLTKRDSTKNTKNNPTENETTNLTTKNETQAIKSKHRSTLRKKKKVKTQL